MSLSTMLSSVLKERTGALDFDEVVRNGGLDFEVEKVPAFTRTVSIIPSGSGPIATEPKYLEANDCFVIRRTDTLQALGHVGKRYAPVQNQSALGPLRSMCEAGLATPVTGMIWDEGATCILALKLDRDEISRRVSANGLMGTEIEPYAIVVLNHNGMLKNLVSPMPFRIYCLNQLPGLGGIQIRHTGDADEKMRIAADKMFSGLAEGYGRFFRDVHTLMEITVSDPAFRRIVLDGIAPIGKLPDDATARAVTLHEKQQARRLRIKVLWTQGDEHTGNRSAWEAMNGAIQALDHDPLFDSKNRIKSAMLGTISQRKRQVMNRLLKYGNSPTFRRDMDNPIEVARFN